MKLPGGTSLNPTSLKDPGPSSPTFSSNRFSNGLNTVFGSIGRALKHRNYRLFFCGQSISLIGTWLTRVATSWLVYRLTKSAFLLGIVGFAGQIPTFILTPPAGVLIDRWNRHRILIITQILAMVHTGTLALLTYTGKIDIITVLALSVFQGCINAFDMPARQSFVVELVEDRSDLPNAIALNSSIFNMARLVGPSFAGILIATFGESGCFAIDSLSYIAVIISLWIMRIPKTNPSDSKRKRMLPELREGFAYAANSISIRSILLILALISLMGMPYSVFLPIIVTEQLQEGPSVLGYLTASSGLGALLGVLYLASRKSVIGLGRIIYLGAAIFGLGLIAFAYSKSTILSLVFTFMTGTGMMVELASGNTILQTIVDEDKRGRVMSLYTMAVAGMVPFGSLLGGFAAKYMGVPNTLFMGGACCLAGAIAFWWLLPSIRDEIRPIYQDLGILPRHS